jgi:hypothetical protein
VVPDISEPSNNKGGHNLMKDKESGTLISVPNYSRLFCPNYKIFKITLLVLTLLFCTITLGKTRFSDRIDYIQNKYASQFESYPILIFDKDELHFRFAKSNAFGDTNEAKRVEIVKSYVFEKTGIEIEYNDASNFESYLTVMQEGAFAVPLTKGYLGDLKYIMCAVFPALPNSNQRLETERLTGLATANLYGDITFNNLKEKMTLNEMQMFSIYHELGHCFDRKFMPESLQGMEPDAHSIHLSESFAEVMGLFFLEKEGITGTYKKRMLYRNLYSRKVGKWMANNPQNSFGNPAYQYGGIIYYLAPVLEMAHRVMEGGSFDLLSINLDDLGSEVVKIVESSAIKARSFAAIFYYFSEGEESVISKYSQWAEEMPDLFTDTFIQLKNYIKESTAMLNQMLDLDYRVEEGEAGLLADLKLEQLCSALDSGKQQTIEYVLQRARDELSHSKVLIKHQRLRQQSLHNFYRDLSKKCHN